MVGKHLHVRVFSTLLIVTLILSAVAVTLLRVLLPAADDYRSEVEQRLSAYLQQPVRIAAMDARLSGFSPQLVFKGVRLLDRDGGSTIARFREARLELDVGASLMGHQWVMNHLTVVGAYLALERAADGAIRVTGMAPRQSPARAGDGDAVGRWLLAQGRLSVLDSRVDWRDLRPGGRHLLVDGVNLELRNQGASHRLSGTMALPAHLGDRLRIGADLYGDVLQTAQWNGDIYIKGVGLHPQAWYDWQLPGELHLRRGRADVELWGHWRQGQLGHVNGALRVRDLVLNRTDERDFSWQSLSGRMQWRRRAGGWSLDLADLQVNRSGKPWPRTDLRLQRHTDGMRLQAGFLRAQDLLAVADLLPTGEPMRQWVQRLQPSGDLRDVVLDLEQGRLRGSLGFTGLEVKAWEKLPGVKGMSGSLRLDGRHAWVELDSRDGQLLLPALFRDPLAVGHLQGQVELLPMGAEGWQVRSGVLNLSNTDLATRVQFSMELPAGGDPYLNLIGDFHDGNGLSVSRYLPVAVMPDSSVHWLDNAFKAGKVVSGGVLFHGRLHDFPFHHGQGRFEVRFRARDVDLMYRPGWPLFTGVGGEVVFDGPGLTVTADAGRILHSQVAGTVVKIDDLLHAHLRVDGHARGPFADVLSFLVQTPVGGRFTDVLKGFRADGRSRMELALHIPLTLHPKAPLTVNGKLHLEKAGLTVQDGVHISDAEGTVDFSDHAIEAQGVSGRLFRAPLNLDVHSRGEGEQRVTAIAADGAVDGPALVTLLGPSVGNRLSGRTPWRGVLSVPHHEGRGTVLQVHTSGRGLASNLPAPLAKGADSELPVAVELPLSGPRVRQLSFAAGQRLQAALAFDGAWRLQRGALVFGDAMPTLPQSHLLRVTGSCDGLDLRAWAELLERAPVQANQTTAEVGGQRAPPVVSVAMDRLRVLDTPAALRGAADNGTASPVSTRLPEMTVQVERFAYGDTELGRMSFRTREYPGRMQIEDLRLQGKDLDLSGDGMWRTNGLSPHTQVDLRLHSDNFGTMMRSLKVSTVLSRGRTDLSAHLSWPGAPTDFTLARMDGRVQVDMQDGAMEEVDAGAGRLLGLFSVQALPRRLQLDFRDLFRKGVEFTSLHGEMRLEQGNAYTEKLEMRALPATILVSGRTGLVSRDFDQNVVVIPDVSGTLPVAGGLAWGPQAGAAIFLFQRLFKSEIDKASQYRYHITGSWEDPQVKLLKPDKS